jgi:hypothetical protein
MSRPDLQLVIEDATQLFWRCWTMLELNRYLPGVRLQPRPAAGPVGTDASSSAVS